MPGKLFVLARASAASAWTLVAGAVDASEAQAAAQQALVSSPGARIVVANAVRSFTAGVTVTEDPVVIVQP